MAGTSSEIDPLSAWHSASRLPSPCIRLFRRRGRSGAAARADAVSDGTVTMDLSGPITSYDPAKGSGFQDAQVAWALYDSLLSTDSNGEFIPGSRLGVDVDGEQRHLHAEAGRDLLGRHAHDAGRRRRVGDPLPGPGDRLTLPGSGGGSRQCSDGDHLERTR